MFRAYLDYVKDNPKGYWFKRKIFGWGWTPVRWQGWAILVIFVALILANAHRLQDQLDAGNTREFLIETSLLVIFLLVICWKTGEPPKWQFGFPKKRGG